MPIKKKIIGLILFSMGLGMFLVLFVKGWGYVLAAIMIIVGLWILYC
jgi:hypothetical protein